MVAQVLGGQTSADKASYTLEYGKNTGQTVIVTIQEITTTSTLSGDNWWQYYSSGQWKQPHSGIYTVPEGQYATRFFFAAGPTQTYDATVGNLIDEVWFSTELPPPEEQKGHLTIHKSVAGINLGDVPENSFSFTVTNNATGEQVASFSLPTAAGSWTHTIRNLPADATYTIEETPPGAIGDYDYVKTTVNDAEVLSTTATIQNKQTVTVPFVNSYTPATGEMKITKAITGLEPEEIEALEDTLTFTWVNEDDPTDTGRVTLGDMWNAATETYEIIVDDLTAGATYTVTESRYEVTDYDRSGSAVSQSATIQAGGTVTVDFINDYTWKPQGKLTITKTLTGLNTMKGDSASFTFKVTNNETKEVYWHVFTFNGGGSQTFTFEGLPTGSYKVEEMGVSGYTGTPASADAVYVDKTGASVAFTNSPEGNKPGDNGYAYNQFSWDDAKKEWVWARLETAPDKTPAAD